MSLWPWPHVITVRCPDDSIRRVYTNVDRFLPLHLKEVRTRRNAAVDVLGHVKSAVGSEFQDKITNLLFRIDEKNASAQMRLRAAYLVYAASPCDQLEYLKSTIDELGDQEYSLRSVELIVTQLRALISGSKSRHPDEQFSGLIVSTLLEL